MLSLVIVALLATFSLANVQIDCAKEALLSVDKLAEVKNYTDAIRLLKEKMEECDDSVLLFRLAQLQALSDEKVLAIESQEKYLEASAAKPKLTSGEKALLRRAKKMLSELSPYLKELEDIKDESVRKLMKLASKCVKYGDWNMAEKVLNLAKKIDPVDPRVLSSLRALWKDLTSFKIVKKVLPPGSILHVNRVPPFDRNNLNQFRQQGYFIEGQRFIFLHPPRKGNARAAVDFSFDKPISEFRAEISVALLRPGGSVVFLVSADGTVVYKSRLIRGLEKPEGVYIRFRMPCKRLRLETDNNGDYASDHSVWLNPRVR